MTGNQYLEIRFRCRVTIRATLLLVTVYWLLVTSSPAQTNIIFQDDFEDGNLTGWTSNPENAWASSTSLPITGTRSMKHVLTSANANSNDYIYAAPAYTVTTQRTTWQFSVAISNWAPSSANRFTCYLMSDTATLTNPVLNGYAVGVNLAGSDDLLEFCAISNGTATPVITSTRTVTALSTNSVEVAREKSGVWTMRVSAGKTFTNLVYSGSAFHSSYTAASTFGFRFIYTSTRASGIRWDNVTIKQDGPLTNFPPVLIDPSPQSIKANRLFQLGVNAYEGDGDVVTLSASNVPAGATFAPTNGAGSAAGTFRFTPTDAQTGQVFVTFYAADKDAAVTNTVSINVGPETNVIFQDDFEDGDLAGWTLSPLSSWTNSTSSPISGARSLKHNPTGVTPFSNDYAIVTTAYTVAAERTVWRFTAAISNWAPSSANRFTCYLMSDTTNLTSSSLNGYAVGINLVGSDDLLKLCRVAAGSASLMIGSALAVAANTTNSVEVARTTNGVWELKTVAGNTFSNLASAGTTSNSAQTATTAFGPRFIYTATRVGGMRWDNFSIKQSTDVPTNIPPSLLPVGPQSIRANETLQLGVTATEGDGDVIALTASNLPANATFSPTNRAGSVTGFLNFTPALSQTGQVYAVSFYASDKDATVSTSINVTVLQPLRYATNPATIWINEFNYDPNGNDAGEYVEVAGPSGFNLTGYSLELYNGGNGASYATVPLSGIMDNEGCGFGAVSFATAGLQNGAPDGIALVQGGTNVVHLLGYEGSFVTTNGPAKDYMAPDIGVAQNDENNTPQLQGSGTNYNQFVWVQAAPSAGNLNSGQNISLCPLLNFPAAQSVPPGQELDFAVSASASGGAFITLTASNLPAGASFAPTNGNGYAAGGFSFTPSSGQAGQVYLVTFYASVAAGAASAPVSVKVLQVATNPAPIWINEINYNPPGVETDEFIEVAGPAGFDLTGYSIILYNGSNGGVYGSNSISGLIDADVCGYGAVAFLTPGMQNGPDGVALMLGTNVIQFLSYGGSVVAVNGPAADFASVNIGTSQDPPGGGPPQLVGSGTNYAQFAWTNSFAGSPGSINAAQHISKCPLISAPGPQQAMPNTSLVFTVSAFTADGDLVILSASNLPANATFQPTNANGSAAGSFIFTPSPSQVGQTYIVDFYATDPDGMDHVSVALTVRSAFPVWINEINYDPPGVDVGEFIEMAGRAGTSLGGLSIYLYDGGQRNVYANFSLSGEIPDNGCGFGALSFDAFSVQNGPDGIALVQGGTGVLQFISYEGSFVATNGPAAGLLSANIGATQTDENLTVQLQGTGSNDSQFAWVKSAPSPDELNTNQSIGICTPVPGTRYVSLSGGHISPFTNWAMAATNLQAALNTAVESDLVLVTNGVYDNGGRVHDGFTRADIRKAIHVRSVNGPASTSIKGGSVTRCAYVSAGAELSGFTLFGGNAYYAFDLNDPQNFGGGVLGVSQGVVSNCVITGNFAYDGGGAFGVDLWNCSLAQNSAIEGGGSYGGILRNCTIVSNTAAGGGGASQGTLYNSEVRGNKAYNSEGGGAYFCALDNCTLIGNVATNYSGGGASRCTLQNSFLSGNTAGDSGGGAYLGTLKNCTVTGNRALLGGGTHGSVAQNCIVQFNGASVDGDNYVDGTFSSSCTTPLPDGTGNITNDPGLLNRTNFHLAASSPCIDRGENAAANGTDLDGDPRIVNRTVDLGSDEVAAIGTTGALSAAVNIASSTVVAQVSVPFEANIQGHALDFRWSWGDGASNGAATVIEHSYSSAGTYAVVLTAWNNDHTVSATVTVSVVDGFTNYVSLSGTHVTPFTSWTTAATNIQAAIDAAVWGGVLLVAPGTYDKNEYFRNGARHRIGIYKQLTVRADNPDPSLTIITGAGPLYDFSVRCAYVGSRGFLTGFTLTNGFTHDSGDLPARCGGGIWCESGAVVSGCVVRGNAAHYAGGGVFRGNLYNCLVSANSNGGIAYATAKDCMISANTANGGGGAFGGSLSNCAVHGNFANYGGGVYGSVVWNSSIISNTAYEGGGADGGSLVNCAIFGNISLGGVLNGGGAYSANLKNCLIASNRAVNGGGAEFSKLQNCVVWSNQAVQGGGAYACTVQNCTIINNTASNSGGGVYNSVYGIRNSIVVGNTAPSGPNYDSSATNFIHSCATPKPGGLNNISSAPQFIDLPAGDLRLQPSSPCVDRGINETWMEGAGDLDGNSRVINGTVDMGAYELVFEANLKGMLQGPYNTNTHHMRLLLTNAIPTNAPYAAGTRVLLEKPSNAVDWVSLQLRRETNGAAVFSRSVWMGDDGNLLSDTGGTRVILETGTGTFYMVLGHRNHLATMTANPIPFTNRLFSYDFTTSANQNYGGTNSVVEVESNVWALIAGDADGDGEIQAADELIRQAQLGK